MSTQIQKALEMAIEALEIMSQTYPYRPPCLDWEDKVYAHRRKKEAIQACKEALAQPAQEPAWDDKQDEWSDEIAQSHPLKTKRNIEYDIARKMVSNRHSKGALVDLVCWLLQKAHFSPSWQGLSDDEIWNIANFLGKNKEWDYPVMFAKTIEQALKERNT